MMKRKRNSLHFSNNFVVLLAKSTYANFVGGGSMRDVQV